jgi:hypothetical protein
MDNMVMNTMKVPYCVQHALLMLWMVMNTMAVPYCHNIFHHDLAHTLDGDQLNG